MAMEDALVLADVLRKADRLDTALRRTFEDAGLGLTGSRRKVAPRRRPGSCLLLRATPLCANEEIRCSATATGLSFLRHSDLIALVCPVTWPLQNYLWAGVDRLA